VPVAQIADEGVTWTRAVTLYQGRELYTQGFVDRGRSPFPPFVNIGQNRTEEILDEQIRATPLITEQWGHTVEADRAGRRPASRSYAVSPTAP
jgi:3-(3-hydroxy-phenyl)propionate hydroxylase